MNCIYSFFKFDVIFGDLYMDYFFKQAFFPSHPCWKIFHGVLPPGIRQEYDSKLASAAKALGQLKRSLGRYWQSVESGWDERSLGIRNGGMLYIYCSYFIGRYIYIYLSQWLWTFGSSCWLSITSLAGGKPIYSWVRLWWVGLSFCIPHLHTIYLYILVWLSGTPY